MSAEDVFEAPAPSKPVCDMSGEEKAAFEEEVADAKRKFEYVQKMKVL
jgi:hypothetical protein